MTRSGVRRARKEAKTSTTLSRPMKEEASGRMLRRAPGLWMVLVTSVLSLKPDILSPETQNRKKMIMNMMKMIISTPRAAMRRSRPSWKVAHITILCMSQTCIDHRPP